MQTHEYKVVPAPRRGLKARGLKTPEARFAAALEAELARMAAEGWEFLRAEALPHEDRGGWLSRPVTVTRTLLVFRRAGPRDARVAEPPLTAPMAAPMAAPLPTPLTAPLAAPAPLAPAPVAAPYPDLDPLPPRAARPDPRPDPRLDPVPPRRTPPLAAPPIPPAARTPIEEALARREPRPPRPAPGDVLDGSGL